MKSQGSENPEAPWKEAGCCNRSKNICTLVVSFSFSFGCVLVWRIFFTCKRNIWHIRWSRQNKLPRSSPVELSCSCKLLFCFVVDSQDNSEDRWWKFDRWLEQAVPQGRLSHTIIVYCKKHGWITLMSRQMSPVALSSTRNQSQQFPTWKDRICIGDTVLSVNGVVDKDKATRHTSKIAPHFHWYTLYEAGYCRVRQQKLSILASDHTPKSNLCQLGRVYSLQLGGT